VRATCKNCDKKAREVYRKRPEYKKALIRIAENRQLVNKAYPKIRWLRDTWDNLKKRSKKQKLEFTLTKDILMGKTVAVCPILKCKLDYSGGPNVAIRASVDRINPKKGYTPDNIQIISFRANSIKSDATLKELKSVVKYMSRLGAKYGS
jgi:hypothetical protein